MQFIFDSLQTITRDISAVSDAIIKTQDDVLDLRKQLDRIEADVATAMKHAKERLESESNARQ